VFTPMNNMKKLKQHVSEDRVEQGIISQNDFIFFFKLKKNIPKELRKPQIAPISL